MSSEKPIIGIIAIAVIADKNTIFDRSKRVLFVPKETLGETKLCVVAAVIAGGSRAELLGTITAPTLVIHGADDPLVHPEGGRDTAARIPGASLEMIDGMGHDLPLGLVDRLVGLVVEHARKSDGA